MTETRLEGATTPNISDRPLMERMSVDKILKASSAELDRKSYDALKSAWDAPESGIKRYRKESSPRERVAYTGTSGSALRAG